MEHKKETDMDMDNMTCFNQQPAQGGHANEEHATNVEAENQVHGHPIVKIGGHGQGGEGN